MPPGLYALIAIAVALAVFAVLHHRGLKLGLAMVASAVTLAVLLGVTPAAGWRTVVNEWHTSKVGETTPFLFVTLTSLVLLVNVLGAALQETGVSSRLTAAMSHLFRSRRAALAGIPLLMGLLPTPGGIMLSAPMVRDLGDTLGVDRGRQAAINFFFRHQFETVWPLFPAVPLVQVILQVSPWRLLAGNAIIPVVGLLAGAVFLLRSGFPPAAPRDPARQVRRSVRDFGQAFWPIALTAGLYVGLGVPAALGILVAIGGLLLLHRVPPGRWRPIFRAALEWDFALLIFGALLYKLGLDAAGAVADIATFLQGSAVPIPVLVFGLPFLVGYVTGVTMPSVAMTFPLLKAFIGEGAGVHLGLEVLAFAGVIVGLYLTPVHLCLTLSGSYFAVPLGRILRLVLWPALAVTVAAFAAAWLLG